MSDASGKGPSAKMGITEEDRDRVAKELFAKPFAECSSDERIRVGGKIGGGLRGGDLAEPENAPPPPKVKFGEDNK